MRMRGKKAIFNYKDTWSLDSVLSPIIASGLKRFKEVITDPRQEHRVGFPSSLYDIAEEGATEDEMFDLWLATLDAMIYAFEAKEPDYPSGMIKHEKGETTMIDGHTYTECLLTVVDEVGLARFRQEEADYWDKVKEGHALFAKFYTSLWW